MIRKKDGFWGDSENSERWSWCDVRWQTVPRAKTHDHRQWTAEYVGSLAAWTTTTGDAGGWNQWQAGCGRKDTVAPDHAGIGRRAQPAWRWCVPETAASEGLAAPVWHARTEKIDESVWRRRWAPTEVDGAETWEAQQVLCCHSRDVAWPATRPATETQSRTLNVWCCGAVVTQQNISTPYATRETAYWHHCR